MDIGYVLVIGSSGVDIKGRPDEDAIPARSNLGRVRNTVGGVARNIAENLARLDVSTMLLTTVGHDLNGKRVLRSCEKNGIDCSYVKHITRGRTGTYMALLNAEGQLHYAISDFGIMQHMDSDYILQHDYLIESASMVVIDATLTEETLATIFEIANQYDVPIVAEPTTPWLASRLCPHLSHTYMVVPNANELPSLCGATNANDREMALQAARDLVKMGVEIAVVTMGDEGLAYADGSGGGYLRAVNTKVVDTTGAGDAFTGAAIFGLLNEVPVDEAMRLGITAASLTLESPYTVLPNLSQELLYARLMA